MKKSKFLTAFALLLSMSMAMPMFATTLQLGSQQVICQQKPVIKNGTIYLSITTLADELNLHIFKDTTLAGNGKSVTFKAGSKEVEVGQEKVTMSMPALVVEGQLYVPAKFVLQIFGYSARYDKVTDNLTIITPSEIRYAKGAVTTTFQNPTIVDGVMYLDNEQLTKALGVWYGTNTFDDLSRINTMREDFVSCPPSSGSGHFIGTVLTVNGTYYTATKENTVIRKDNKTLFPIQFYADQMNAKTNYNEATKTLTVIDNGPKYLETTADTNHRPNGYVQLPDGTPSVVATVQIFKVDSNGNEIADSFMTVQTDKAGYYEFDLDEKYAAITVSYYSAENKQWYGEMPSFVTKENPSIHSTAYLATPTNVKQFPIITLIEQS